MQLMDILILTHLFICLHDELPITFFLGYCPCNSYLVARTNSSVNSNTNKKTDKTHSRQNRKK